LTAEESRAYVQQRLRIAGSDGRQIFNADALTAIHRYSSGIPRVVNLLCEHCLVSAFVDQKTTIAVDVVDAVARDFDLSENTAAMAVPAPPPTNGEKFDLVEALRTLATVADKLRQSEHQVPKERKS
jgi:hypothetical protein